MTVLNVLSTNSVAAGASEYQTVQTGYYRVGSTAGAATVSFNGGAAITLVQNEFILIKGGKPGQAKIVKGVDDATAELEWSTYVTDTAAAAASGNTASSGAAVVGTDDDGNPDASAISESRTPPGLASTLAMLNSINTELDSK